MSGGKLDLPRIVDERESERGTLHSRHLNEQLVRVLKTIGFDVGFKRGQGQYLYDRNDQRYLDLLSGFGVFAIGRNHPVLRDTLKSVLDSDLPNLVQMDVSMLAGILAERLLGHVPYLDKAFFANSGTECVEAAIKFARGATGRPTILYMGHAYHGLSYGSLSLTDDKNFRAGFEPLLPGCTAVPFNDLAALEQALANRQVAAFVFEPIQGKGVNIPDDDFLPQAAALCRRYGTLLVADEIQTGYGTHRQIPRGRALECRTRHGAAVEVVVGRPRPGRRAADAQGDLQQDLRPHGSCRGARLDLLQERPGDGRSHRHARRHQVREADRERRNAGCAHQARVRRTWSSATNW